MRKKVEAAPLVPGDRAFFQEFYETYKDVIWQATKKFVSTPEDREDLAQETVIRLMRNVETLRSLNQRKITSYIHITVQSQFIDQFRTGYSQRICSLENDTMDALLCRAADPRGDEPDPTVHWEVIHLFAMLPARDRFLLENRYILGLSAAELAQQLGCTDAGVRMALSRARERARKILAGEQEGV